MDLSGLKKYANICIILSFLLIGAILRLYQIGFQCYWTEEQWTQSMAALPVVQIIIQSITADNVPPLYYIAAHFFDMRYVSAACGILSIPVMYCVGGQFRDKWTGYYAAGITAILFPLVYYSQFGRNYSMSFLAFAIALFFYIRAKHGHYSGWFVIAGSIAILVHLYNVIPVTLMLIDILFFTEYGMVELLPELPIIALAYGVFCYMADAAKTSRSVAVLSYGMPIGEILSITPAELFGSAWPLAAAAALYGWISDIEGTSKIMLVALITVISGFAMSFFTPFFPRYFLEVDTIFILLASIAFNVFSRQLNDSKKIIVLYMILGAIFLLQYNDFIVHYTIQKYIC